MNAQDIKPSFCLTQLCLRGKTRATRGSLTFTCCSHPMSLERSFVRWRQGASIWHCYLWRYPRWGSLTSGRWGLSMRTPLESVCGPWNDAALTSVVAEKSEILLLDVRQITANIVTSAVAWTLSSSLIASLRRKNIMLSRRIQDAAPRVYDGKLIAYLNTRSQAAGSSEFDIYNRQQLADYLGVDKCWAL